MRDALQDFVEKKTKLVFNRSVELAEVVHSNITDGIKQTHEDYMDCINEIHGIELEFNYCKGTYE